MFKLPADCPQRDLPPKTLVPCRKMDSIGCKKCMEDNQKNAASERSRLWRVQHPNYNHDYYLRVVKPKLRVKVAARSVCSVECGQVAFGVVPPQTVRDWLGEI